MFKTCNNVSFTRTAHLNDMDGKLPFNYRRWQLSTAANIQQAVHVFKMCSPCKRALIFSILNISTDFLHFLPHSCKKHLGPDNKLIYFRKCVCSWIDKTKESVEYELTKLHMNPEHSAMLMSWMMLSLQVRCCDF